MFIKLFAKIRNANHIEQYELVLAALAGILVFRVPATIGILLFVGYNLFFYKQLVFSKQQWIPILVIAIPVLLDILFLWNNESISGGFKHMEKRVSTFVFPLLIISQASALNLNRVLRIYSYVFSIIMFLLFVRFIIVYPELINKYLSGIDLWEMGYSFANSTTVHAPALNMHVSFLVVVNFYLLIRGLLGGSAVKSKFLSLGIFVWSFVLLLIVNTRLAIANAVLGLFLILFMELAKRVSRIKLLKSTFALAILILVSFIAFAEAFPYAKQKFTTVTFSNMDMVGRLDEFEDPEGTIYNSLVTRLSIWKTAWERAQDDLWLGVGAADGKDELNQAYLDTNQQFLAKYKFPTHNQYLDFLLKFGVLGFVGVIVYILHIAWLGVKLKHSVILFFFVLFFTSNLTDDFLIRFDGITFSAFWISVFASVYLKSAVDKNQSMFQN
jgi:O-antigen ligase